MSYDIFNKVVRQSNGRIIYSTGYGLSTIEPDNDKTIKLQEARRQIQREDTKAHGWKR